MEAISIVAWMFTLMEMSIGSQDLGALVGKLSFSFLCQCASHQLVGSWSHDLDSWKLYVGLLTSVLSAV